MKPLFTCKGSGSFFLHHLLCTHKSSWYIPTLYCWGELGPVSWYSGATKLLGGQSWKYIKLLEHNLTALSYTGYKHLFSNLSVCDDVNVSNPWSKHTN